MHYVRLKTANLIAKKRFKKWYPDFDPENIAWSFFDKCANAGKLRKTNVMCSCHSCRNPRHSNYFNSEQQLTVQERKAPTVQEEWY